MRPGNIMVGEFEETRPIPPDVATTPPTAYARELEAYRVSRRAFQESLIERYTKENLVLVEHLRYPLSITLECDLSGRDVEEELALDGRGTLGNYELPGALLEWGRDRVLEFMRGNPLVRNPKLPDLPDSTIAHPCRIERSKGRLAVWYQKATFHDFVLTNLAMDVRSKTRNSTLRDALEPGREAGGWKLRPVESSLCASTLGIGCLVRSREGKYVLTRRSGNVSSAKDSFSNSAGGFLRWDPDEPGKPPSMFEGVRSHLREELGVLSRDIGDIHLMGITRDLERGGQTDAHFLIEVGRDFKEIEESSSAAEHRDEFDYVFGVEEVELREYIKNPESAPSLVGGLTLLTRRLP